MKKAINHGLTLIYLVLFSNAFSLSQSGTSVFDESFVHEIRVTFEENDFWDILNSQYNQNSTSTGPNQYLMATNISIDNVNIDSVGVRQKGNFSNWGAMFSNKKPLKLDFKEFKDHKFDGLKKLNLANGFEDPSMLRDVLAYKIMRDADVIAPRTAYTKLYLNDQYWGLYIMIEQIDSEFLEDNYTDPDGNLYKCINNTNLNDYGNQWDSYTSEFKLKTNEDINDNSRFIDFVKKINQTPDQQFRDSLDIILNTDKYLSVLACDILMFNWDSYYDHGRNFYVYLNPEDNKFQWIPWDYNLAFSGQQTDIIVNYQITGSETKPLVKRMQEHPEYQSFFFQRICYILLHYFNLSNLENYIDNTAQLIRPALDSDPNKFFSIQNFDDNIINNITVNSDPLMPASEYPGIKSFLSERMNTVMNQLASYNFSCALSLPESEDQLIWQVYPNPLIDNILTVDIPNSNETISIEILSATGESVHSAELQDGQINIDFSEYRSGLYFVKATQGDRIFTKKVVKN